MGKGKHFKGAPAPKQGKVVGVDPRVTRPGGTDDETPVFDFCHLGGRYCLTECNQQQQAAFVLTLHRLSKLTWGDITRTQRHGLGSEKFPVKRLKATLPASFTPDVEHLLVIRFDGKAPMLGHRDGRVFTVLILDRDFTAYDHG